MTNTKTIRDIITDWLTGMGVNPNRPQDRSGLYADDIEKLVSMLIEFLEQEREREQQGLHVEFAAPDGAYRVAAKILDELRCQNNQQPLALGVVGNSIAVTEILMHIKIPRS